LRARNKRRNPLSKKKS